ncbi:sterol-sensing domain of SREBP cleavage-activation-domain-containing protein [Hyaloraphidium curvatum]|nr:sterol-sensing domain of SREBP cleavage-activation-domain-containing protein [Hyaloraphidium curvatum]
MASALRSAVRGAEQLAGRVFYYHGVFAASHRVAVIALTGALIVGLSLPAYFAAADALLGTDAAPRLRTAVRGALPFAGGAPAGRGAGGAALVTRVAWGDSGGGSPDRRLRAALALDAAWGAAADPDSGAAFADLCFRPDGPGGACLALSPAPYLAAGLEAPPAAATPVFLSATLFVDGRGDGAATWARVLASLANASAFPANATLAWDPPPPTPGRPPRIEPRAALSLPSAPLSTNHLLIVLAYLTVFLYISLSLGRVELVKSKFGLGIAALATVLGSLTMSMGILDVAGVPIGLVQWEVLPFLIIAVGVENIFVITNGITTTSIDVPVPERVGRGLGKVGVPILVALFGELFLFLLGTATSVPALQEFSLFASVAVVVDFFLQITFFVTVLSIDVRRLELADLSHRRVAEIIRQSSAADLQAPAGPPHVGVKRAPSEAQVKAAEVNAKLAREKVAAKSFQQRTTVMRYVLIVFLALFGGFLFVDLLAKNSYRPAMSVFSPYGAGDGAAYSHEAIDAVLEPLGERLHPFLHGYRAIEWTETLTFSGEPPAADAIPGFDEALRRAQQRGAELAAESAAPRGRRFPRAARTTLPIVAALLCLTFIFVCWTNLLHRWLTSAWGFGVLSAGMDWLRPRADAAKSPLAAKQAAEQATVCGPGGWESEQPRAAGPAPAREVLDRPWIVTQVACRLPGLTDTEHDLLGDVCLLSGSPTPAGLPFVRSKDRRTVCVGEGTALQSAVDVTCVRASGEGDHLALGRADGRVWLVALGADGEVGEQWVSGPVERAEPIVHLEILPAGAGAVELLSVSAGGEVAVWERSGDALVAAGSVPPRGSGKVTAAAYSKEAGCLVVGFADGALERYLTGVSAQDRVPRRASGWGAGLKSVLQVECLSISRPSSALLVAVLYEDGTIRLWDTSGASEPYVLCTIEPQQSGQGGFSRAPRMAAVPLEERETAVVLARRQADNSCVFWRVSIERAPSRRRESSRSSSRATEPDDPLLFKAAGPWSHRSATPPLAPIKVATHHRRITAPSVPSPLVNITPMMLQRPPLAMNASPVAETPPADVPMATFETPSPETLVARAVLFGSMDQLGCSAIAGLPDLGMIVGLRRRRVSLATDAPRTSSFYDLFRREDASPPVSSGVWVWEAWGVDVTGPGAGSSVDSLGRGALKVPIAKSVYAAPDRLRGLGCRIDADGAHDSGELVVRDETAETVRSASDRKKESEDLDSMLAGAPPVLTVRTVLPVTDANDETCGFCFDFGDSACHVAFAGRRPRPRRERTTSQEALQAELQKILDRIGGGPREPDGARTPVNGVPSGAFEFVMPRSGSSQGDGPVSRRTVRRIDGPAEVADAVVGPSPPDTSAATKEKGN